MDGEPRVPQESELRDATVLKKANVMHKKTVETRLKFNLPDSERVIQSMLKVTSSHL